VTVVNEEQTSDIQEIFQNHEFVSLPIGVDGTHRIYRIYVNQGVVCCDFLLYRTSKGRGGALRNEATLLLQNFSQLHAQLQSHPPPLSPPIYCHAITFLGKKAYVLANENGQLVSTRLLPLLIIDSESLIGSVLDLAQISPLHIIPTTGLDQYLTDTYNKTNPRTFQIDNPFHQLRKSYRTLGLALILLPLLLGLSGIFWGFSLGPLAILLVLVGISWLVLLTRKASKAFHKFRNLHTISIPFSRPLIHSQTHYDEPTNPIYSPNEDQPDPFDEVVFPQTPWTPNTTATFFQNSIGPTNKHGFDILANPDTTNNGESE